MSVEKLKEIQKQRQELKVEQERLAKVAFAEASSELFVNHPQLESFSWTQYTPFYNDGDPCNFRSNHDYSSITLKDGNTYEEGRCEDEDPCKEALEAAQKDVQDVLSNFSDEDMEDLFGDHVEVTVTADGVDVDEYDHD